MEKIAVKDVEKQIEFDSRKLDRAIRKIDLRILPLLIAGYFFGILDRANIGYARIANAPSHTLDKSLRLSDVQAQTCISIFFITYVILEVPSNMAMKKSTPSKWLSFIWTAWGLATIGMGFVQDYAGLVSLRLVLGVFESGYFPGVIYFLTYWYPQNYMTLRIGMYSY